MSTNPTVTVILPAHNAENTIAQSILSTLNQSFRDFELWVLENGSTDRTAEIAKSFTDPRVRVFELGSVGFYGALKFAIENTSSEWLARMDADDLMFPDRLKVQLDVIKQRPELVMVGTAYARLTPFGHIFERIPSAPSREIDAAIMSCGRIFADPSVVFKRSTALEVGGFDTEFPGKEVTLWFRLMARGKVWEIAEPQYLYRLTPNSLSQSKGWCEAVWPIRSKYAPQTVPLQPPVATAESVWREIAAMELLAGDGKAVRRAADHLAQDGFVDLAKQMRLRSYMGRIAPVYYGLRSRGGYRHRPDWEKSFAPLLAQDDRKDSPSSIHPYSRLMYSTRLWW